MVRLVVVELVLVVPRRPRVGAVAPSSEGSIAMVHRGVDRLRCFVLCLARFIDG